MRIGSLVLLASAPRFFFFFRFLSLSLSSFLMLVEYKSLLFIGKQKRRASSRENGFELRPRLTVSPSPKGRGRPDWALGLDCDGRTRQCHSQMGRYMVQWTGSSVRLSRPGGATRWVVGKLVVVVLAIRSPVYSLRKKKKIFNYGIRNS